MNKREYAKLKKWTDTLTDEEFDKAMEEKVEGLDWERVILLKVSV